jgi:hypothetical protein
VINPAYPISTDGYAAEDKISKTFLSNRYAIKMYNGSCMSNIHVKINSLIETAILSTGSPNVKSSYSTLDNSHIGFYDAGNFLRVSTNVLLVTAEDAAAQEFLNEEPVVHQLNIQHQPWIKPKRYKKFKQAERAYHKRLTKNLRR